MNISGKFMDYSLRVPLNEALESRLKRYAEQRGKSYSEVVRELIGGLPLEKAAFDYELFRAVHERSIRKLDFWLPGQAKHLVAEMMECDTRYRPTNCPATRKKRAGGVTLRLTCLGPLVRD